RPWPQRARCTWHRPRLRSSRTRQRAWMPYQGRSIGLRKRFGLAAFRTPGQCLQDLAVAPGVPCLDGDGHECLAPRERRILIALATQQTVAKHQNRVPAVETRTGRQVFSELLGLLWIEAQKQGSYDGPQADPTLNARCLMSPTHTG